MDGILIVDKPRGFTSHDVVDFIRRKFRIKKAGHAGTLDPQATGVLVILLGRLTKKSGVFSADDKEYQATLELGVSTDTQDAQGRIIKQKQVGNFSSEQIEQVFKQFLGKIEQVPSMFSALKHKGQRLYSLARKGIEVQRPAREVFIHQLQINKVRLPHIYFSVKCSKGTYIRTLCADIAERLGCPGHMSELRRVSCGPFSIKQAIGLDRLKDYSPQQLRRALLNTDETDQRN